MEYTKRLTNQYSGCALVVFLVEPNNGQAMPNYTSLINLRKFLESWGEDYNKSTCQKENLQIAQ